jgi:ACDE family multidrug resistance protein
LKEFTTSTNTASIPVQRAQQPRDQQRPPTQAPGAEPTPSIWKQPASVWVIAFACVVSFMGIGLVDPILPAISHDLGATNAESMLLFTSYLFITGIAMFFTSWVSSRITVKWTLVLGLVFVVIFAALAGLSGSVEGVIGWRAGWGLGNALFISTALAAIVGAAAGGSRQAIVLYEAALGIGLATGPLLGGLLGSVSWRMPFFGTAVLMAIALIATIVLLKSKHEVPHHASIADSFKALKHPSLLSLAAVAFTYNFGFFVLLAYSPFPLEAAAEKMGFGFGAHELGLVFFGWGLCLAITSVIVAPVLTRRFGLRPILGTVLALFVVCHVLLAVFVDNLIAVIAIIIFAGLLIGIVNTALTEATMEATHLPRNVASSAYSGVRFIGGAIAPAVAGPLAAWLGTASPYWLGAISVAISFTILMATSRHLVHIGRRPHESAQGEAEIIATGTE